jgi:hypothetical protein
LEYLIFTSTYPGIGSAIDTFFVPFVHWDFHLGSLSLDINDKVLLARTSFDLLREKKLTDTFLLKRNNNTGNAVKGI